MRLPFYTCDVFTRTRYLGNPLAIVVIPHTHADQVKDEHKHKIAREFNLSETIFLYQGSAGEDVRASIWITSQELPFAGHPTIGSCFSLLTNQIAEIKTDGKSLGLLIPAGRIEATLQDGQASARIPHDTCLHSFKVPAQTLKGVVPTIQAAAPLFSIVRGMTFALVEVSSLAGLAKVRPNGERIQISKERASQDDLPYFQNDWLMVYAFMITSRSTENNVAIRTRMMLQNEEDPATGSAAAALSAFLTQIADESDCNMTFQITQGVEMARQSDITVRVRKSNDQIESIRLEGSAVQVMQGELEIDLS